MFFKCRLGGSSDSIERGNTQKLYKKCGSAARQSGKVYKKSGSAARQLGKVYKKSGSAVREVI